VQTPNLCADGAKGVLRAVITAANRPYNRVGLHRKVEDMVYDLVAQGKSTQDLETLRFLNKAKEDFVLSIAPHHEGMDVAGLLVRNVPVGMYQVTVVDANGCVATRRVNMTSLPPLTAKASGGGGGGGGVRVLVGGGKSSMCLFPQREKRRQRDRQRGRQTERERGVQSASLCSPR
jgi:hypothetical protein